jgi:hypothetical protein
MRTPRCTFAGEPSAGAGAIVPTFCPSLTVAPFEIAIEPSPTSVTA